MAEWIQVSLFIEREVSELVSEFLIEQGSNGTQVEDTRDYEWLEGMDQMLTRKLTLPQLPANQVKVLAYFPADQDITDIEVGLDDYLDHLADHGLLRQQPQIVVEDKSDQDFENNFDCHYQPIQVSRYLQIVPASKMDKSIYQGPISPVVLDPGLAFGTGQHPTTLLAMFGLERVMTGGEEVLDVGSGSGVLAITAARLGAGRLSVCDIDPQAVKSSKANLELNQISTPYEVFESDLLSAVQGQYDVMVANIVASFIAQLLPQASPYVKPGGALVISGILQEKESVVVQEIEKSDFQVDLRLEKEEWVAYVLTKPEL